MVKVLQGGLCTAFDTERRVNFASPVSGPCGCVCVFIAPVQQLFYDGDGPLIRVSLVECTLGPSATSPRTSEPPIQAVVASSSACRQQINFPQKFRLHFNLNEGHYTRRAFDSQQAFISRQNLSTMGKPYTVQYRLCCHVTHS